MNRLTTTPSTSPQSWDPWFSLYFGALMGCVDCFQADVDRIVTLPDAEKGDAWAIAARGWWMLGSERNAERAWSRARARGGAEVEALLPFVEPGGAALATRRARGLREPGIAADAWCDVVALRLLEGDVAGALRAVVEATDACPDHAEARHWQRALDVPDLPRTFSGTVRVRPGRRGQGALERDFAKLLPGPRSGWLSPERHTRRILARDHVAPPPESALARLAHAGLRTFFLAPPEDQADLVAAHPLAAAELELDLLVALVDEGRPALTQSTDTWQGTLESGDPHRARCVAELLCELATRDPALLRLALVAADRLLQTPESVSIAKAYRAWFRALLEEPDAAEGARSVLAARPVDYLPWRLAIGALFRSGAEAECAAEIARVRQDPARTEFARRLAWKRGPLPDVRIEHHEPRWQPAGELGGF